MALRIHSIAPTRSPLRSPRQSQLSAAIQDVPIYPVAHEHVHQQIAFPSNYLINDTIQFQIGASTEPKGEYIKTLVEGSFALNIWAPILGANTREALAVALGRSSVPPNAHYDGSRYDLNVIYWGFEGTGSNPQKLEIVGSRDLVPGIVNTASTASTTTASQGPLEWQVPSQSQCGFLFEPVGRQQWGWIEDGEATNAYVTLTANLPGNVFADITIRYLVWPSFALDEASWWKQVLGYTDAYRATQPAP